VVVGEIYTVLQNRIGEAALTGATASISFSCFLWFIEDLIHAKDDYGTPLAIALSQMIIIST
jgi:hypothetical protein